MDKGLDKVELGDTGLEVTRLGYGAMELRSGTGGPPVDERQAGQILNAILDLG